MQRFLARFLVFAAFLLALTTHGFAQSKSPAQILTDISGQIVTNTSGRITAPILAGILTEIVNSAQFTTSSQNANVIYAGPGSGGAANPTFRGLVPGDLPIVSGDNIVWGTAAGNTLSGALGNVLIGRSAGQQIANGIANVCVGYFACNALSSSSSYNAVVGYLAGNALSTGQYNVIIGYAAGLALTTWGGNVFIGRQAGAGFTLTGDPTPGIDGQYSNVAIGEFAAKYLSGNGGNYCIGYATCGGNTNGSGLNTGYHNVALGRNALGNVTQGLENTAVGDLAGNNITLGGGNVYVGRGAGITNTVCSWNTFVGHAAGGFTNSATTTCNQNVALGDGAATLGGPGNRTGQQNISIGTVTGPNLSELALNNTIAIGSAPFGVGNGANVACSNCTALGINQTYAYISGSLSYTVSRTTVASAAGRTYTAAQLQSSVILRFGAESVSDTTPTAAQIVANLPECEVHTGYQLNIINNNSGTLTIVAGTGVTLSGQTTVAPSNTRQYLIDVTNCTLGAEAVTLLGVQMAAS